MERWKPEGVLVLCNQKCQYGSHAHDVTQSTKIVPECAVREEPQEKEERGMLLAGGKLTPGLLAYFDTQITHGR